MKRHGLKEAALLLACCGIAAFAAQSPQSRPEPEVGVRSDAPLGIGGFNTVHPVRLGTAEDMKRQMVARLAHVEALLRSRDVADLAPELRRERLRNLDRLRDYRLRAEFPANEAFPGRLSPCFIDDAGNICAVGYLVERSAGRGLAERINARYRYATVSEMSMPELDAWIAASGLTHAEVVTIQEPGFNRRPSWREQSAFNGTGTTTARTQQTQASAPVQTAPAIAEPMTAVPATAPVPSTAADPEPATDASPTEPRETIE